MLCNCGSSNLYNECCGIYHKQRNLVKTAEALMRSRYCAYTLHNADYIYETTLPAERKGLNKVDILNWAKENKWMGLEILDVTEDTVEFKAHYLDHKFNPTAHHELSLFKKVDNQWYYVSGKFIQ